MELPTCPEPQGFVKWYRRKVTSNLDALAESGKSLRVFGFGVTEEQVNRRFKLVAGDWEPGDILAKLTKCGISAIDKAVPATGQEANGLTIAIKPLDVRRLGRGPAEGGGDTNRDGSELLRTTGDRGAEELPDRKDMGDAE